MTHVEYLWRRVKNAHWLFKHATTPKGRRAAEGVYQRALDAFFAEARKLRGVETAAPISETRRRVS